MFDLSVCYLFLQYFDTVGWVFWPVKTVSHITYTVLVEMLNHAHSLTITILYRTGCKYRQTYRIYQLSDRPISNVLVINRQYWLHIVSKFVPFNFTFLFIIMNEHAHEKFRVLWNVIFAWNPLLMITCCWQLPTFHSTGALLCARDALLEASLGSVWCMWEMILLMNLRRLSWLHWSLMVSANLAVSEWWGLHGMCVYEAMNNPNCWWWYICEHWCSDAK